MKKSTINLLVFIAARFLVQYFAIDPVYELHRDEYLHIDMGRHPALGFTSVPPFSSLKEQLHPSTRC